MSRNPASARGQKSQTVVKLEGFYWPVEQLLLLTRNHEEAFSQTSITTEIEIPWGPAAWRTLLECT
jgi:hypothetical protein